VIRQSVPIIKEIIEAYNIPILEVPRYEARTIHKYMFGHQLAVIFIRRHHVHLEAFLLRLFGHGADQNPTHIAVAFDPKGPTFRHEAFEQYKAQREETPEVIRQEVFTPLELIRGFLMKA